MRLGGGGRGGALSNYGISTARALGGGAAGAGALLRRAGGRPRRGLGRAGAGHAARSGSLGGLGWRRAARDGSHCPRHGRAAWERNVSLYSVLCSKELGMRLAALPVRRSAHSPVLVIGMILQPFLKKSRTPSVAQVFQIGLCGVVVEADSQLFGNSWSARFLREQLYTDEIIQTFDASF